ncbi:PilZ domain-containing protein [Sphingomonas montana]|uniref:PilZ domain-containing protein n=1 Tax=Sphingomonas montana TaxID=1843236 RepID=UPI00096D5F91|nr:PilZ domain-containing protein [Sphingomonas montana]
MIVAQLKLKEMPDRRAMPRWSMNLPGQIMEGGGTLIEVSVRDLSARGFLIDADVDLPVGAIISIETAGATLGDARVVRQIFAQYGCEFVTVGDALNLPTARAA